MYLVQYSYRRRKAGPFVDWETRDGQVLVPSETGQEAAAIRRVLESGIEEQILSISARSIELLTDILEWQRLDKEVTSETFSG